MGKQENLRGENKFIILCNMVVEVHHFNYLFVFLFGDKGKGYTDGMRGLLWRLELAEKDMDVIIGGGLVGCVGEIILI